MRINVKGLGDKLSQVRGIGSYNRMLIEAVGGYGSEVGLEIGSDGYDVNLVTDFNPFVPVKMNRSKPNVVVIHDLISVKYPKHFPTGLRGRLVWWQNLKKLRQASGILTDTEAVRTEIVNALAINAQKVKVVPIAAKAVFEKAIAGSGTDILNRLPPEFILYVGDVTWNKNLPRLGRAVKKINKTLVLAGAALNRKPDPVDPWQKSFRDFYMDSLNDKRFIFPGFVSESDLVTLYRAARMVALVSIEEGFGYPWLEAAWCRTPVVLGRCPATAEVAGEAAYYVNPESVSDIASGLEAVFNGNNQDLVARQFARAKKFSQREFIVKLKKSLYNLLHV